MFTCIKRHYSNFAQIVGTSLPRKLTFKYLISLKYLTPRQQTSKMREDVLNYLGSSIKILEQTPYGFSSIPEIKNIIKLYQRQHNTIKDIRHEEHLPLIIDLHDEQKHIMNTVARGLLEWKKIINEKYREDIDLYTPGIKNITKHFNCSLKQFFSNDVCIWTVISQYISLIQQDKNIVKSIPLVRLIQDICKNVSEKSMVINSRSQKFKINGIPINQYDSKPYTIKHIYAHLYVIIDEIIKNSVEATMKNEHIDSINIDIKECNNTTEMVVTNYGEIMDENMSKIWDYGFSTSEINIMNVNSINEIDISNSLSGYGFGLPITRILVKYFDGEIKIKSSSKKTITKVTFIN